MVRDLNRQAKFDFRLYCFFCSGVILLDLPKNTIFSGSVQKLVM
jgi:hypothetical protein